MIRERVVLNHLLCCCWKKNFKLIIMTNITEKV